MSRRVISLLLLLVAVTTVSLMVFRQGYGQLLGSLAQRGESDLSLAADRLTGQLQRYQDLSVLMTDHPALRALSYGEGDVTAAEDLLLGAVDRTGVLNMAYLTPDGVALAEARPGAVPDTDYMRRALAGAREGRLGRSHGVDPLEGVRSYVFAAPNFAPGGGVVGILMVSVNVELLEQEWRGDRPAVIFADKTDEVFISNRSELLGWRRVAPGAGFAPPGASSDGVERDDLGGMDLWTVDWSPYLPRRALHLERDLPQIGMRAEALVDAAPVRRLAALQATVVGLVLLVLGLLFFAMAERRRALAEINMRLESRVAARTAELSGANAQLRREVAERQEAEAALKRAQAELVQAGKLSALGQMSAGLSHELNQPLMAIRQFAGNGALFLERGKIDRAAENLTRIEALAGRMGRIIRNLRAFARQENEPVRRIDLVPVIDAALEMTEARLRREAVTLHWERPNAPLWAMGGEVRLGQVMVNLITNAADAMAGGERRVLTIRLTPGKRPMITVRDTGPGIAAPEKIFDPFYSTKEGRPSRSPVEGGAGGQFENQSEGMGLGLSISYGLVQSFGGDIRGRTHPDGGAEFTIWLDGAPDPGIGT